MSNALASSNPIVVLRRSLALLLACLLAWLCLPASAQLLREEPGDAITSRAWLGDAGSELTPQAALAGQWAPFADSLARGFTSSTTWLRLTIDPAKARRAQSNGPDRRLVLLIMPGHLDEVAVFRGDRAEPLAVVGDRHPASDALQGLMHYAVVLEDAVAPFDVLLRLRTQSNHSIHVQAMSWDDAVLAAARQHSLVIAYLVFTIMVIAWASMVWWGRPDAVLGFFIAKQAMALLVALTLLGMLRQYGPDWLSPALDRLTSLAIPAYTVVAVLFHSRLLAALGAGKAEVKLLQATVGLPALALFLVALGEVRAGLMLAQSTIPFLMTLTLVTAWRARPEPSVAGEGGSPWRRAYLVAVYAVMALLTIPQSLRVLGVIDAGKWSYGGFMVYGVASAILLGSLLIYRAQEARVRSHHAELALTQARREAEAQRSRAAEQAELMTMLTHELKTPLSVVSLALGEAGRQPPMRERALRAVGNMRNVIDRCAQVAVEDDLVSRHGASPKLERLEVGEVLVEAVGGQLEADRVDCRVAEGLPACQADLQMLRVIVGNLLENALKYGPAEGRISASVEASALEGRPGVALRVTNAVGPAGPPDPERIFEKYHRGERARHLSGSGLGLYLSRRLAYRLGGELTHEASAADEVAFKLWLPT